MTDTLERVRKIVVEHLDVDAAKVVPKARFDDLGADSLDMAEIVMMAEEEFEIDFDADELGAEPTVADAVALIDRLRGPA